MPRQLERPQQRDYLLHIPRSANTRYVLKSMTKNMAKKKIRKPQRNPLLFIQRGMSLFPRQPQTASEQAEELPPAAIPVTVSLRSPDERDHKRDKETQQAQPGKEYVEKTQHEIQQRSDPEIVVPALFHTVHPSCITITLAGHSLGALSAADAFFCIDLCGQSPSQSQWPAVGIPSRSSHRPRNAPHPRRLCASFYRSHRRITPFVPYFCLQRSMAPE